MSKIGARSADAGPGPRAQGIRLVLTDVDGVLTSSHLLYGLDGAVCRAFSTRDGAGIQWLGQSGIPVVFLSALDAPSTRARARDLGVDEVILGAGDKRQAFFALLERRGLEAHEVAYMGDDLLDLPVLLRAGLAACPADAAPEVLAACHWRAASAGGAGAFRALAEFILKAQGRWPEILARYEQPGP